MLNRTLENRIERAERTAKAEHRFSSECICFPADEQPFFGFPLEEQIASKVKCPLHGDRRAISLNMENSRLWKDGRYDCAACSCNNLLPRNKNQDQKFWEHIEIASGSMWASDATSLDSEDACAVFWATKLVN